MSLRLEHVRSALSLRPPVRVLEPATSRAAVAVVLKDGGPGLEILFIRRAERDDDPWSGHVGFPGGRSEPGDADLPATARRETEEEIGLDLGRDASLLGGLDEIRAMARGRPVDLAITPFVFHLRGSGTLSLGPEVTSAHWLSLDALLRPEGQGRFPYRYGDQAVELPCLRSDGLLIWGLTYRMFGDLKDRLREVATGSRLSTPGPAEAD